MAVTPKNQSSNYYLGYYYVLADSSLALLVQRALVIYEFVLHCDEVLLV